MSEEQNTELQKLNSIIEEKIRPALKNDGGDLEVMDYKDNVLTINYHGACHGCPHAAMGTLNAIQNVLREQFNPDIVVKMG